MNVLTRFLFCSALFVGFALCALADNSKSGSKHATSNQKAGVLDGEKLFQTQCNRCHNAPEEIPPRAVRAIVMHMRERAILSEQEQRALLQYLAPGEKTP